VLVDSFITLEQARAQADWIASTGKNLTTIYATHGHGDHFFGASVLLGRFPKARFVAAPSAIKVMKEQSSPEFVAKFWESRFPHQLPKHLVVAEELRTNLIELEGERLIVIPLGFTDTAGTTCLHVPSLQLIAAGDAAYNGVHPRLMEANQNQKRGEWFSALDKIESLKPRVVVAGHKNMKTDHDGPRVIGQTRQYILDFQELAGKTTTAKELYDQMLGRYPEWLNRGAPLEFGEGDEEMTNNHNTPREDVLRNALMNQIGGLSATLTLGLLQGCPSPCHNPRTCLWVRQMTWGIYRHP